MENWRSSGCRLFPPSLTVRSDATLSTPTSCHGYKSGIMSSQRAEFKMTELTQRRRGDNLREKTTLDINEIMQILPHRHPFVLIDRVLELKLRKRIVAVKNVSLDEELLTGHFPGRPVLPGILIAEAIAQAGGILLLIEVEDRTKVVVFLTTIERARFRRPVVPGDQLRLEINVTGWRPNAIRVEGIAYVGQDRVAEVSVTSAIRTVGEEEM
jgi:3-hydroxyacyl-[acyl-carrier-protein] dehydratase